MMSKAAGLAPVPAAAKPLNQVQPQHILLRGPALLFLSLWSLILPALIRSSLKTQLSVGVLLLGALLTVLDVASAVRTHLGAARRHLGRTLGDSVLDDVLRSIFAPDTGLIAVAVGTFVGAAGMYALPLSEEQRIQLFGTGLADYDPNADARDVLMRPGGIIRLLPESWREMLLSLSDGGGEEEEIGVVEDEVAVKVDGKPAVGRAPVVRDMAWDESNDDDDDADDNDQGDGDSATDDATDGSESSHDALDGASESGRHHTQSPRRLDRPSPTARSVSPPPTTPLQQQHQVEDPAAVAAAILTDLVTNLVARSLRSIDATSVRTVGLASTLTLLFQLRRSRSARAVVWSALQGAVAVGLAGTAVGAAAVLEARRRSEAAAAAAPRAPSSEEQERDGAVSAGSVRGELGLSTDQANRSGRGMMDDAEIEAHGDGLLGNLLVSKSVVFQLFMGDGRLRRRLQAAVAVFVLAYFRRWSVRHGRRAIY